MYNTAQKDHTRSITFSLKDHCYMQRHTWEVLHYLALQNPVIVNEQSHLTILGCCHRAATMVTTDGKLGTILIRLLNLVR